MEVPHARGARAEPSAGGYGSAPLSHLLGQPPIPWGQGRATPPLGTDLRGPFTSRPGRPWGLFSEGRYEPPPAWGVTRRCTVRCNLLRRAHHERATGSEASARNLVRFSALTMNDAAGTREGRRRQKPGHPRHRAFPGWHPGAAATITAPEARPPAATVRRVARPSPWAVQACDRSSPEPSPPCSCSTLIAMTARRQLRR